MGVVGTRVGSFLFDVEFVGNVGDFLSLKRCAQHRERERERERERKKETKKQRKYFNDVIQVPCDRCVARDALTSSSSYRLIVVSRFYKGGFSFLF